MKCANFFIQAVIVSLLVTCGPVTLPDVVKTDPQISSSPVDQPTASLIEKEGTNGESSIVTTQKEEIGEISQNSPVTTPSSERIDNEGIGEKIELKWNTDPNMLILSATFCCGHVTNVVRLNYIPDALIWGDGRIIRVQYHADSGERRVLESSLTSDQMHALLQRIADDGFFDWQDNYADHSIADAAEQCLSIELDQQSKKVCEYFAGAPQAFHDLYTYIASGTGITGSDHVPEIGYLTAHPLDFPEHFTPQVDRQWSVDTLGLPLGKAVNGVWVEGEVLEMAWSIVNANWRGLIVQERDGYYHISVQVPGLNQTEPPVR